MPGLLTHHARSSHDTYYTSCISEKYIFFKNTKNKKKLKFWLELLTKMPSITITNMDVIIGDTIFCELFVQKINLMLKFKKSLPKLIYGDTQGYERQINKPCMCKMRNDVIRQ